MNRSHLIPVIVASFVTSACVVKSEPLECYSNVDCEAGETCRANVCVIESIDGGVADSGMVRDGGVDADSGVERDAGPGRDGGTARDGGELRDGGAPRDGGLLRDGGAEMDGGMRRDGGPNRDGGPTEVVIAEYPLGNYDDSEAVGTCANYKAAQDFIADQTATLTSVVAYAERFSNPTDGIVAKVYSDALTPEGGSLLATSNVATGELLPLHVSFQVPSTSTEFVFAPDQRVTLTAGNRYFLVFERSTPGYSNCDPTETVSYRVGSKLTGTYANGRAWTKWMGDDEADWNTFDLSDRDLVFEIRGYTGGLPPGPVGCTPGRTLAWTAGPSMASGTQPVDVVAADFDRDGFVDIIAANNLGSSLDPYWGGPGVTFAPGTSIPIGSGPDPFLVDLNRDGFEDLVVSINGGSTVEVLLGTGTRSFTSLPSIATCMNPGQMDVADVSNDGLEDILVACGSGGFDVVLATSATTFAAAVHYIEVSISGIVVIPSETQPAPDIVVARSVGGSSGAVTDAYRRFLNNGSGGFPSSQPIAGYSGPHDLVAGDFNGDGRVDLAATNWEHGSIFVHISSAGAFPNFADLPGQARPTGVQARDVNQDCVLDLLWPNLDGDTVQWRTGVGTGAFSSAVQTVSAPFEPRRVTFADFDLDGRIDMAVARQSQSQPANAGITVFLNDAQ